MRILLIKLKHIGDTLILTPTITAIRRTHPDAEIWVVVRRGCEGILAGCPEITRLLTVASIHHWERDSSDFWNGVKTLWALATHRFDFAFELGDGTRGRNLIRVTRATRKVSVKPADAKGELAAKRAGCSLATFDWSTCHRVEMDFHTVSEFLPLPEPIPPLRFDAAAMKPWSAAPPDYAVVQVGTRQGGNRWLRENWLAVGRGLLERLPNIVITCGPAPHEIKEAAWLQNELGPRALTTAGRATWPEMAWLLQRAKLYVGPSTAAMHLAAACGCPVVGLFGWSIEDHWHPWQVPYRIVSGRRYVAPADPVERYAAIKTRPMNEIEPADVLAASDALIAR